MFSSKINNYTPIKDDKLKTTSNSNFDFEGEGFSSMLEEEETLTGKLRETEAELLEDESILSTDEENQAIARRNQQKARENAEKIKPPQAEIDSRNLLKLMDMSTKINMSSIQISKSKKELENLTGTAIESGEELSELISVMSSTDTSEGELKSDIDLNSTEKDRQNSQNKKNDQVLHETEEELLEDLSILSTDEENLAMVNKNREYKQLTDNDFSHNGEEDMQLLSEITSIQNQAQVEVRSADKIKNAENIMAQVIEESKQKTLKLSMANLASEDVDYIINILQNGGSENEFDDDKNPSALSLKFLAALKDAIKNKKVFRIDFDNEISVIIKIDVDGKISANFLTSNKEIEDKLKNNLYLLKQKFEEEGIKYNNIDSTLSEDSELDVDKILNTLKDNTNIGEESNV